MERLIAHGAIISIVNKAQKTCCELADGEQHPALAAMLELALVFAPADEVRDSWQCHYPLRRTPLLHHLSLSRASPSLVRRVTGHGGIRRLRGPLLRLPGECVCVYVHFFMRVSTAPTGASPMRCHPPRRPP